MDLWIRHGGHGATHVPTNVTHEHQDSYFYHTEHTSLLYIHISLSALAWCFVLPIAVFLSIGRTKWTLPAHVIFCLLNGGAIVTGVIYNINTPDLYENNLHHKLGGILSGVAGVHSLMTLVRAFVPKAKDQASNLHVTFPAEQYKSKHSYSWSRDSGVGSSNGASPRNSLPGSPSFEDTQYARDLYTQNFESEDMRDVDLEEEDGIEEKSGLLGNIKLNNTVGRYILTIANTRAMRVLGWFHEVLDRTILILGYILVLTGLVTYGGIFKGHGIFSGLAHFIKGSIFFWIGLLSLGRVMGSCADLGWAWNMKPTAEMVGSRRANAPSMEFVESFLIFFYGSTNVFLEHLGSQDGAWSATDLEHVSIALMFLGTGLAGLLVESKKVRTILNSTITSATSQSGFTNHASHFQEPRTYGFSLNPFPAITIFLLGFMMSSHTQESMVSTMLHSQWGSLFIGAALTRGLTYLIIYLNPPTSYLPSRPPTEIVAAFCFISGGMIFMSSNSDMVEGIENLGLNAMVIFTIMMGVTAFIMAWTIVVLMVKGIAVRAEQARNSSPASL